MQLIGQYLLKISQNNLTPPLAPYPSSKISDSGKEAVHTNVFPPTFKYIALFIFARYYADLAFKRENGYLHLNGRKIN